MISTKQAQQMAEPVPGPTNENISQSNDVGWLRRVVFWTDYPVAIRMAAELRLRRIHRGRVMK